MDRRLDSLDPRFRPRAVELIARCIEAGLAVMIVSTRRTAEEQAVLVRAGASQRLDSLHLRGFAIDLAPYAVYQLHGLDKLQWDASDPAWAQLGILGEALGLVWGGRWRSFPDFGHFEMKEAL